MRIDEQEGKWIEKIKRRNNKNRTANTWYETLGFNWLLEVHFSYQT